MYLIAIRPGIMYSINLISRFMESPKDTHWKVGIFFLRYIIGTIQYEIFYVDWKDNYVVGYIDNDFAGTIDDRKSISNYAFHLGTTLISWASKKQPIVSISSAQVEYVTAIREIYQATWLKRLISHHEPEKKWLAHIFYDNKSTIVISENHVFHHKSKHIDAGYNFIIHGLLNNGDISLQFYRS